MSRLVQIRRGSDAPTAFEPTEDNTQGDLDPLAHAAPAVYVETLGCQMNEADSAIIVGRLAASGYRIVRDPAHADVILLNTCAVREKAEERVYGRTSQLLDHRRNRPHLVFGVAGCMAEHLRDKITERAPHVSLIAGPDSYRGIAALVDRAIAGERVTDVTLDRTETYEGLDGVPSDDGVSGQVSVQRGCDKFCTFCVVPHTRGRERGVPPREVLRQVRAFVERGYKEVVLLGQTVNSYRYEDVDFADLVRAVAAIPGLARLRFTSPYPVDFSPKLLSVMAETPEVCRHVHLPVQSGSSSVLERMHRGYDRDIYLRLVDDLRARLPGVAISTDLMVGFCGETEAEYEETLTLMSQVRFDSAFMFRYSDRSITYASRKLKDDVPDEVKARRLQAVIDLQERHTRASNAAQVGRRVEVLVSGPSKRGDAIVGRTSAFHNVLLPREAGRPGDLVMARIHATTGHSLLGRPEGDSLG